MSYDQVTADVIAENNLLRYQIAMLKDETAILKGERDRLKLWQEDVQSREAAVCPEDVGFDEYIRVLNAWNDKLNGQNELAVRAVERLSSKVEALKADLSKANTKVEQLIEQLHAATEDYADARNKTLEEASKQICQLCAGVNQYVLAIPLRREDDSAFYHYFTGPGEVATRCVASSIRALAAPETRA